MGLIISAFYTYYSYVKAKITNEYNRIHEAPVSFKIRSIPSPPKQKEDQTIDQQTIDNETVHSSYVGRLLGDYGIRPLENAWYRFSCVDKQYREWGQPYFATNPDKGTNVCVG
jgi:hypothetical protein